MPSVSDPLLQPLSLRHLTLKNRIVSAAHEPAYSEDGLPKTRYRLYHEAKARGGMAMTMIGGSAVVAPDSPPAFGNLLLYKDEIVPWLAELADAVHQHDCAVMCQITHLGRRTRYNAGDWLPVVAASGLREPAHRAFPKVAEEHDLARIVRGYADAAARCQAAGLDGIEIEAYGHFLDGFLSPWTNRRDDAYGGTLANRLRFPLAVIEAIRQAVGPAFIVGIRLAVDELLPGGLARDEGLEICRLLEQGGAIDFLNVIRGHIDSDAGLAAVIPNMGAASAPHLAFAGEVRRAVGLPVLHAARINDVATARYAIREGLLDLVGMVRAHMAEPNIAALIQADAEQRIRPCVGAGYCIDGIYENGAAYCIHNPATGREATLPQVIVRDVATPHHVVVIGAGPAGLEAARASAERGHRVTLLEANAEAGGQVRIASLLARRREMLGITEWRLAECQRLGVELRFNCYAEAEDVLALEPDTVIVATGGLPQVHAELACGEAWVQSSWDALADPVRAGERVLVFDDHGGFAGLSAAEHLAGHGALVTLATPERTLGIEVGGTNSPAFIAAFDRHGVKVHLNRTLSAVSRGAQGLEATLTSAYCGDIHETLSVDRVIAEHGTAPLDGLYHDLKGHSRNLGELDLEAFIAIAPQRLNRHPGGHFALFRIGDAIASRNVHAAVYDGLRLALGIG
ncbi:NADH:flavin oxidoreductase [Halomonas sp. HP20-15]|uniref:NADH:flavin oxidoreductase n=1 Tax=Halomonas sp. HP20-15 TaxID=3085901 RepID=UPI0029814803|nr:NADH:flavin oxidoreductase [Halomonas sp. HP20-15]MDW5378316.1 NADH:flavin oxidoreductase [Halomonas sp. HP20-15]